MLHIICYINITFLLRMTNVKNHISLNGDIVKVIDIQYNKAKSNDYTWCIKKVDLLNSNWASPFCISSTNLIVSN